MRARVLRGVLIVVGVVTVLAIGLFLMDKTLSRHEEVAAASELVVEMTVATRTGAEAGNAEFAEALIVLCQVEVRGRMVDSSLATIGHNRYRFVIRPSLDDTDQRQLSGCLQDFWIDNVLANVVSMDER